MTNSTPTTPTSVSDLVTDPDNRRRHSPRNLELVADALRHVGAARSIVIDEENVVLAGNGVTAAAAEAGITRVRVIDTAGDEIIAVRRTGLSADDKRALALYDNRTSELAAWNVEQLEADLAAGLTLAPWFTDEELQRIIPSLPEAQPQTEPELASQVRVEILCTRADLADFQATLTAWQARASVEVHIA